MVLLAAPIHLLLTPSIGSPLPQEQKNQLLLLLDDDSNTAQFSAIGRAAAEDGNYQTFGPFVVFFDRFEKTHGGRKY